ncbi:MAG: hypothetical protein Cons2KO_13760 [Congregibacter sp.]
MSQGDFVKFLFKLLGLFLAVVVVVVVALGLYLNLSHQPEPFPAASVSESRLQDGPFEVASFTEVFVDRSRETQANGDYPGARERRMEGDVWYPRDAAAGPGPLLVFSHGFTSLRSNGEYLGEHLASHGFVVVAVDYPLTYMSAPGGPRVEDVVNQPGDVSFLIDTLSGYSAVSGHALSGKVDGGRVGVFGISLGGLTSTLAAFHPEWRDPRIGASISIAGPTNFFTPAFFEHSDVPFMMLAGDIDALVPYADNAMPVVEKSPGAELVTLHGGSHTGFSGGTAILRAMNNTDAIGCWSVTRYIDNDNAAQWEGLFGPAEWGFDYASNPGLCEVDPLPPAMNTLRQQMIARVVIRAFFESWLSEDVDVRESARRYLDVELASELHDVSVASAP